MKHKFVINETDSVKIIFSDQTSVFLQPVRKHSAYMGNMMNPNSDRANWENDFILDPSLLEKLKTKAIESVTIRSGENDKAYKYDLDTDKKVWVKNALALL